MKVNYKIIDFLALLGLLAAILSLPYVYGLLGDVLIEVRLELGLSESIYNAILIGQAAIIYSIAALIGGLLYRRAGFRVPLLERIFDSDEEKINLKPWFLWSAGTGVALAVVIIAGDYIFYRLGSPIAVWWNGTACLVGGPSGCHLRRYRRRARV